MRGHIGYYLKGIPGAGPVKNEINQQTDFENVKKILKSFLLDK
jgi:tRNA-dihydrouridine synthase